MAPGSGWRKPSHQFWHGNSEVVPAGLVGKGPEVE